MRKHHVNFVIRERDEQNVERVRDIRPTAVPLDLAARRRSLMIHLGRLVDEALKEGGPSSIELTFDASL